jgi:hypothetical protein
MDWTGFFEKAAVISFIIAFSILIIVGYAHGGSRNMSLCDPALKNPISSFGKKCLYFSGLLICMAVVFAMSSIWLMH